MCRAPPPPGLSEQESERCRPPPSDGRRPTGASGPGARPPRTAHAYPVPGHRWGPGARPSETRAPWVTRVTPCTSHTCRVAVDPRTVWGGPPRHRREARRNGPPRTSPRAAPGRHSRADPAHGRGARGRTSRGFRAGGSRCVSCRNVNASDIHGIHRENIRPPMGRAARTRPSQGPVHARYVLPATLSSRNTVSITVTH